MVDGGWWSATPHWQRQDLLAERMLTLPADDSCWLFGAWARWYRRLRADGRWQPCPPPLHPATCASARPSPNGAPIPPPLVPAGPDFAHVPPAAGGFVGAGPSPELTAALRVAVESAAALSPGEYPHRSDLFAASVPSTVAVTWDVMLWCATAPVFDAALDDRLVGLWSPYRSVPLPPADEPRWLTPPTLAAVLGPYAERLRAGRVDCASAVLHAIWATAGALRGDNRFRARADALLAVLEASLRNPVLDYAALPHGEQAIVRQWLTRCPPELEPALRAEASPGDRFRDAYHDLAVAAAPAAGDPDGPGFCEPRHIAAALLAADLATVRQDLARPVVVWLDAEIRELVSAMLDQPEHPLRRLWPGEGRLPPPLRGRLERAEPAARDRLLAAAYALDLAWCRLVGIPARPRGFPAPVAVLDVIHGASIASMATLPPPDGPPPVRPAKPAPVDEPSPQPQETTPQETTPAAPVTVAEQASGEDDPRAVPMKPRASVTSVDRVDGTIDERRAPTAGTGPPDEPTGPTGTLQETSPPSERRGTRIMPGEMVDELLEAAERRGAPGDIDRFLRDLDEMLGLTELKHTVRGLVTEAKLAAERAALGLPIGDPTRHLIFLGEPGTGKTTVAGLIAGAYAALGLLDSGHLVTCDAGDPAAVAAQVGRARGGALLIRDAHRLDDAPEVMAELRRLMRDRRDQFMIICAGPPDDMNVFLVANPGFRAEFGAIVEFQPPSDQDLVRLFSRFAERDLYVLDEELRAELLRRFGQMRGSADFANARTARKLFEQAVARQAARLAGDRRNAVEATRLTVLDLP